MSVSVLALQVIGETEEDGEAHHVICNLSEQCSRASLTAC